MDENSNIDYTGLAAYVNGECSPEERDYWENWIRESEENRQTYLACLTLLSTGQAINRELPDQFDSRKAWQRVNARISPAVGEPENRQTFHWLKYAAAFLIGAVLITYVVRINLNDPVTVKQLSGIQTYYLPDSSQVTLNGKSSFTYPENFDTRQIELTGKAFFRVRSAEGEPFIVNVKEGYVRVLGTAFLVDEQEDSVLVKVEHGLVALGLHSSDQQVQLSENESGKILRSEQQITKTTLEHTNDLYWATRQLTFRQTALPEVLEQLSELFDKKITYDHQMLSACKLTAVFRDQRFDQIISNLALSFAMDYEINENEVIITSATCN